MSYIFLGILGYLACSIIAYRLFWKLHVMKFMKVTRGDDRFFMFVSFMGPASLFAALLIYLVESDYWKSDEVIWPKKKP